MKLENVTIGVVLGFILVVVIFCSTIIYKNTVKEPTVNERIEECKRLGMNDISVSMYDTYSSVSCRGE